MDRLNLAPKPWKSQVDAKYSEIVDGNRSLRSSFSEEIKS